MTNDHMLLHANAHHMAVAYEPLAEAVERIEAREFGAVTSYRGLALPRYSASRSIAFTATGERVMPCKRCLACCVEYSDLIKRDTL